MDFLEDIPRLQFLIVTKLFSGDPDERPGKPCSISARRVFNYCSALHHIDIHHDEWFRVTKPKFRSFDRILRPPCIDSDSEMEVITVGEDEVYAWREMDFHLVDEDLP